jgi:hypothetical protein
MLQFPVDGNSREQCVVFVVRQQPSYSLPRQQPFIVHFELTPILYVFFYSLPRPQPFITLICLLQRPPFHFPVMAASGRSNDFFPLYGNSRL